MTQALGFRMALGVVFGIIFSAAPAYQIGKWSEGSKAKLRIAEALAQRDLTSMEATNARVDQAWAARLDAGSSVNDGSVPDDGFRRD